MSGVSTGSTPRSVSASSTALLDELVRDVVQDLAAETLADHLGRHLAGTEAREPCGFAVASGDARDLRVHDVGWNLDRQVPACFVDVDEFGFHVGRLRDPPFAPSGASALPRLRRGFAA